MKNNDYSIFYNRITAWIRRKEIRIRILNLLNRALTLAMYIIYPLMTAGLLLTGFRDAGFQGSIHRALPYILVPGISFALVSIARDLLNWKRPYEEHDIRPLISKNTKGHSMPSRHVFSCTVIAMCVLSLSVPAGILCLVFAVILCLIRVLGGVHYPRDVAAGFFIGALAGWILLMAV